MSSEIRSSDRFPSELNLKSIFMFQMVNDQEIEFQEIEIGIFHEIWKFL